jgi:hypothetical protein
MGLMECNHSHTWVNCNLTTPKNLASKIPQCNCSHTWVNSVRYEVFTAVTMKNGVFWDVTPCGSCKNRRFRGT